MITDEMVLAGAKAIYRQTATSDTVVWDLLPDHAQELMLRYSRAALEAAEALR